MRSKQLQIFMNHEDERMFSREIAALGLKFVQDQDRIGDSWPLFSCATECEDC